ncbi:hypothetical protein [Nitrobacter sp. TKz-YC02]|uniref:hypothetical protein n=1 Tax=Nitrobacter sp. TKz-YC02 TaxID=3398704 RepID=UPI003CE6ED2B
MKLGQSGLLTTTTPRKFVWLSIFFRTVQQETGGTIETTGHSLGGALAGFVASLYGLGGTTFDNIGFRGAVESLYDAASTSGLPYSDPEAKEYFYGSGQPWQPNYSGLTQFALQGDIAAGARSDFPQTIAVASDLTLDGISAHSQARPFGKNRANPPSLSSNTDRTVWHRQESVPP